MEHINFEKYEVNEELREITFSCASDTPYERYDFESDLVYNEILVVSEDAVDVSRLNNSAPLLFNHDCNKLLGMVEKAYIIENKVFVKVRFSRNDDFADRIFKDILDGVIKNVSIGYQIEAYEDKKENGIYNRYVTRWMIFETSIVSIPADASVGIRSKNIKEVKNMEENKPIETAPEAPETPAEAPETAPEEKELETVAEAEAEVAEEMAELEALKQENEELKLEVEKLERLLADDETPAEAPEAPEAPEEKELDDAEKEEIEKIGADFDIPQEEIKSAIDKKLSVKEFKKQIKTKTFNIKEKETENMNRKEFREFLQARNFDNPFVMRDFSGFAPKALVATETLPLVAMLEKKLGLKGYRTISGLNSQIEIPVQKSRNTVTTPGINEASTDSNPTFEKLTLAPVKFTASTVIGKEMLVASNSDVEAFIIDSITRELAYEVENYMLGKVATGAGREINYSALNAMTWADALAFEAAIGGYNVADASFVMSAPARATLKNIAKSDTAVAAGFICENNEINGYAVNVSGCVKNDNLYFGAWDRLILAQFGQGLEILVDPYTEARSGAIVVVGSICIDAGVDAPEAFAIGKVQESSSSSES